MPNEVSRKLLREKGCFDFNEEKERFEKEALDPIREEEEHQRQVKDDQERDVRKRKLKHCSTLPSWTKMVMDTLQKMN